MICLGVEHQRLGLGFSLKYHCLGLEPLCFGLEPQRLGLATITSCPFTGYSQQLARLTKSQAKTVDAHMTESLVHTHISFISIARFSMPQKVLYLKVTKPTEHIPILV